MDSTVTEPSGKVLHAVILETLQGVPSEAQPGAPTCALHPWGRRPGAYLFRWLYTRMAISCSLPRVILGCTTDR